MFVTKWVPLSFIIVKAGILYWHSPLEISFDGVLNLNDRIKDYTENCSSILSLSQLQH